MSTSSAISTIDKLRDLTAVVVSWLETPSVEGFDTSGVLFGASEFALWYNGKRKRWDFRFGPPQASAYLGSFSCTFDLTAHGVVSHRDAMTFLESETWDAYLQVTAGTLDLLI